MARYGGAGRFAGSIFTEIIFGMLMAPAVAFRLTLFLIGLLFGHRITWGGQIRDAYGLSWRDASVALWPQTLFGLLITAALVVGAPQALPWAAPVLIGLVFAVPFAVATTSPRFGSWMARRGFCATPEEVKPNATLVSVSQIKLPTAGEVGRDLAADGRIKLIAAE